MMSRNRVLSAAGATLVLAFASACTTGNILGGILGGTTSASGMVQGIDTRNRVVTIQQQNGQTIQATYDNNTQVVYGNQNYGINALHYGDQVAAQVSSNYGGYYLQSVQVLQSASNSPYGTYPNGSYPNGSYPPGRYPSNAYPNGGYGSVQQFVGTVQQVSPNNGWFTLNTNGGYFTVVMPNNAASRDLNRFRGLRVGDYVNINGMMVNNGQIQLTQFR